MLSPQDLCARAATARERAYAPYSGYLVGAAVEWSNGEVTLGCNVENLSYGATICAERTAIVSGVGQFGSGRIAQIAVVTKDGGTPCGMCLQVISEFAGPDAKVHCCNLEGGIHTYNFRDLLPHGFASGEVGRTTQGHESV